MGAIIELLKKYGIKKVLEAISDHLRDSDKQNEVQLGRDIKAALKKFEENS